MFRRCVLVLGVRVITTNIIKMYKTAEGLTLIELLISISILCIVALFAVPSFRDIAIEKRLSTVSNNFIAATNYARAESIRKRQPITLCISSDGTNCLTNKNWEQGWLAFVDIDGDGVKTGTEEKLRGWGGLPDYYSMRGSTAIENFVSFDVKGMAVQSGAFALCFDMEEINAKSIIIDKLSTKTGPDNNNNKIPDIAGNTVTDISDCTGP